MGCWQVPLLKNRTKPLSIIILLNEEKKHAVIVQH